MNDSPRDGDNGVNGRAPVAFHGKFTVEIRQRMREKRTQLGATFLQLAEVLKINWSTLRKWEDGQTDACHMRHVPKIVKFLRGDFDAEIRIVVDTGKNVPGIFHSLPPEMIACMEKVSTLYSLCEKFPDLRANLNAQMLGIVNETVDSLLMRLATRRQQEEEKSEKD